MTETLDLTTLFDRATVKMPDGTTYELRNQQEFGILDEHRLRSLLKRAEELRTSDDDSEEAAVEASKLLRSLATMLVVDLETEIPDWACVAIFDFWTKQTADPDEGAVPPRKPRTTVASSRGSKRSTAATRKRGGTSRAGR